MLTTSHTIYPSQFTKLEAIISAIQTGNQVQAKLIMNEMAKCLSEILSLPEQLQTQLFVSALYSRLDQASEKENLYLVPDEGQQIRLFNFMAEKFPVVRHAQDIANTIFLNLVAHEEQFVILDVGIGTGQQIASLVERLAAHQSLVKQITVLGIEPSAESIAKAEICFQKLEEEYDIKLSFTAFQKTVEQLDTKDWNLLCQKLNEMPGKLLINASFALHHIRPLSFRTEFFKQLKMLKPEVFVIIEPYADYTTDDLMERFRNAWHHYGLTFLAIDTIDSAFEKEKSAVKQVFFGREMIDVLGVGNRVEQFETAEMWLQRLIQAEFSPFRINHAISDGFNPLVQVAQTESYCGFNVKGYPIVAVICVN